MGKRKRRGDEDIGHAVNSILKKATITSTSIKDLATSTAEAVTVQIITGSYERTLHGITATLSPATSEGHAGTPDVSFADTFLFNAHSSAIRCLALSPPSTSENPSQPAKVILASGGTDERINLYHLSASPPARKSHPAKPTLAANPIKENPRNRELGALLHHSSSVSALYFPSRSKLLSSSEDNTIAVVRTRDWTVLSTIKAPIPKALGRPSGDTAPPGGSPAGVNDFSVHPSMKLMVSVGKGEKCMRLWNLVTGKKAGVLNFGREILQVVGEGRWGNGDGRKVEWDSKGEEFAVGFERGVVIFGMDSKPKCRVVPQPLTKIHQVRYVKASPGDGGPTDFLAVSTEDGRIIFYSTTNISNPDAVAGDTEVRIPNCHPNCQLGGKIDGLSGRIKDFEVLGLPSLENSGSMFMIVAGCSDGVIRLWTIAQEELQSSPKVTDTPPNDNIEKPSEAKADGSTTSKKGPAVTRQAGRMIGTYETGHRITCLKAFVMSEAPEDSISDVEVVDDQGLEGESSDESGST